MTEETQKLLGEIGHAAGNSGRHYLSGDVRLARSELESAHRLMPAAFAALGQVVDGDVIEIPFDLNCTVRMPTHFRDVEFNPWRVLESVAVKIRQAELVPDAIVPRQTVCQAVPLDGTHRWAGRAWHLRTNAKGLNVATDASKRGENIPSYSVIVGWNSGAVTYRQPADRRDGGIPWISGVADLGRGLRIRFGNRPDEDGNPTHGENLSTGVNYAGKIIITYKPTEDPT